MKNKISKTFNYVYKITCLTPITNERFYIGVHSSNIIPTNDIKYMGSSKYLKEAIKTIGKINFVKEILSVWHTRSEAENEELRLLKLNNVTKNEEFFNKHDNNNKGLNNINHVSVIDTRDNSRKIVLCSDYSQNSFYTHTKTGLISSINTQTFNISTVTKEVFENDELLVGVVNSYVSAKDISNNKTKQVSKIEFDNDENLVGHSKGMVVAFDINNGIKKHVSLDDFNNNDNLVSIKANIIKIYNDKGILVDTSIKQFPKFCKTNGYPFKALTESYQNNGTLLYTTFSKPEHKQRVINNGNIKYKGWYAIKENHI